MAARFRPKKIVDILRPRRFTRSVEVFPPRNGKEPDKMFERLRALSRMKVDFVSITKGAGGSHRGGTVPLGFMMGDRYRLNALVHFRARDLTRRQVENELVDHHYFGIQNILAVMGDPLKGEPAAVPDPATHHRYASDLVRQISQMNHGRYMALPSQAPDAVNEGVRTDFCIGVACYPEREDPALELRIMQEKVDAGATFAITQMCFWADKYTAYVDRLRDAGVRIPVIPGVRPVASSAHVDAAERIFGATVPPELKRTLAGKTETACAGVCRDFTVDLIDELKAQGAPGVHLFILNDVEMARSVLGRL